MCQELCTSGMSISELNTLSLLTLTVADNAPIFEDLIIGSYFPSFIMNDKVTNDSILTKPTFVLSAHAHTPALAPKYQVTIQYTNSLKL